jgi:predicted nuclease with TOPRIM domain
MATKEEIQKLLRETIAPLEGKLDNLNNGFKDLKKTVDFLNEKYDDHHVLSQLRETNEKVHIQGTSLKRAQKDFDDIKKESREAIMGYENLAQ